ncbi:MAG: glycosyltransferase family 2 protein [Bacteroidales bacterium]|nr:glycosyltransferase family 2 protein [Bacteroidales bacterium]
METKSKELPLISVLMTTYNRAKYIEEAIESVIASTYKNWELIIVDDCSTDNTEQLVKKYLSDPRIQYHRNEKNLGQFPNRNKAASLAKGEYIKYLDSDDIMYPNCLSVLTTAVKKFPDAGLIGELYYDNHRGSLPTYFTPEEAILTHYFKGNRILNVGPTSLMYKKNIFMRVGGFRTDIGILADVPLNYEIAMLSPIVGTQKSLIYWRIHEGQVTVGQSNQERMMVERYNINLLILNHPNQPLNNETTEKIKRNIRNILARNILKLIFKLKLRMVKNVIQQTDLKSTDFIKALCPNYKLHNYSFKPNPIYYLNNQNS